MLILAELALVTNTRITTAGIYDLVNAGVQIVNAYDRGDKEFVDPDRLESDRSLSCRGRKGG